MTDNLGKPPLGRPVSDYVGYGVPAEQWHRDSGDEQPARSPRGPLDADARAILAGLQGDPLGQNCIVRQDYGMAVIVSRYLAYPTAQDWVTGVRLLPDLWAALVAAEAEIAQLRACYEQPPLLKEDAP